MVIFLLALGTGYAAICVWLTVRIANRRERWAKRTMATIVGVPLLYLASFGPTCWVTSRTGIGVNSLPWIFRPILMLMPIENSPADLRQRLTLAPLGGTGPITLYFYPGGVMSQYANAFAAENWGWRYFQKFDDLQTSIVPASPGTWEWRDLTAP